MKLRAKIALLTLIGLYFITRWARTEELLPGFFRNHFTDFLFIPVQLLIALWGTRLIKRDTEIRVPVSWVAVQVIFVSLLFEWYLPVYSANAPDFTADPVDVGMYVLGGLVFIFFQRKWA